MQARGHEHKGVDPSLDARGRTRLTRPLPKSGSGAPIPGRAWHRPPVPESAYEAPGGSLVVEAEEAVQDLAARLFARRLSPVGPRAARVEIETGEGAGPCPEPPAVERLVRWEVEGDRVSSWAGPHVALSADRSRLLARGRVSRSLLSAEPSLCARLLLETPAAHFATATCQVLHAGAVVGRSGAVVLRGASGAGKSTLVAALYRSGLRVLADESLLVSRADPDLLFAAVRDLTVRPDTADLLGLGSAARPAFSGGEEKLRLDLFPASSPADRTARRRATVLLGPREPGPARLLPLEGPELLSLFGAGAVAQETSWGGDPGPVATAWAVRETYRLLGASDLAGAVALVTSLTV